MKKKRSRKNKWDERQELKWEHRTIKCLYEAAKDDMANGVFSSIRKCAIHYNLNDSTLGKLIRENREYVGDGKKSQGYIVACSSCLFPLLPTFVSNTSMKSLAYILLLSEVMCLSVSI